MTHAVTERWRVVEAWVAALDLPADVTWSLTVPTEATIRPKMLWVASLSGDISAPVATGGRLPRDDEFEARVVVSVLGLGHDQTHVRSEHAEIVARIEDTAAADHGLDGDAAVVSHQVTRIEDLSIADTGESGLLASCVVVVEFHNRLT